MAVANVALKIYYPEGTKQMSTVYGQTMHHPCMSGEENSTNRTCVDYNFTSTIDVNHHRLFQLNS